MSSCKHSEVMMMMAAIAVILTTTVLMASTASAQVGVCYGTLGNNLPQAGEVVAMYRQNNIRRMRLYFPSSLHALRGSGIELLLDVPRENLQALASDPAAAAGWVRDVVRAFWPDVKFKYISVGNELIPGRPGSQFILPAMRNIYNALSSAGLQNNIKVSTAVDAGVLGVSYPPSAGAFTGAANAELAPIVQFLSATGAPFLANIYPYFSYSGNPTAISLPYALFTSSGTVVRDGQYNYQNLFDAMLDAFVAAVQRAGGPNVPVVVSESGWPSAGGFAATVDNARTYNQNLIRHAPRGSPRRPGRPIEYYIFAMFNENQKQPPGIEQNFGLFYPSKQPVYSINFLGAGGALRGSTDKYEGEEGVGVVSSM